MSRVGTRPIKIHEGIKVCLSNNIVTISNDSENIDVIVNDGIDVTITDTVLIERKGDDNSLRALHGLTSRLITNAIDDLKNGCKVDLEYNGTGYRVVKENNKLVLSMGYSHPIEIEIPQNVDVDVKKNAISINGQNRKIIGDLAAKIREVKPPEVYKGKGIRYKDEIVKRKAGKAAQAIGKE